jgi:translation initiation factor IF-2
VPIRIYALAKELSIDSKELVTVCKKAGIHGKGSALASLDDEELAKVKSYLASGSASSSDSGSAPARKAPEADAKAAEAGPISRDDYIAPGSGKSKIKVITAAKTDDEPVEAPPAKPKVPTKRQPVINIAKMPDVKQPAAGEKKSDEPKAQEPEIRLPKDAITSHKRGVRAPLEHLRRDKEKKPADTPSPSPAAPASASPGRGGDTTSSKGKRRGKTKEGGDEDSKLAGMANTRQNRQSTRRHRAKRVGDDDSPRRRRTTLRRTGRNTAAPRKGNLIVEMPCTVRSLSQAIGVNQVAVLGALMKLGVAANINSTIDEETVEILAEQFEVSIEIKSAASLEDSLLAPLQQEDDESQLAPRPPVITFLGHVDHGKTSLLDRIIGIDVVSGEAGGITQHIRAYKTTDGEGREIAFVDTPGHEAFTEMRARGANVTDIAVLVIAADDGIMPQTEEAISHALAAEVPIVVALNKIDLPGVDINRVMTQMTEHHLTPSEWGGDVEVVRTSAITGEGMDTLLETLLTIAELHDYRANPDRNAVGVCLESEQEGRRGVVAKVMVNKGTLNVGDILVCGSSHGRIKAMYDTLQTRKKVKSATPSTPVNITGLDSAPEAGEAFYVLDEIAKAREITEQRAERIRHEGLAPRSVKISFVEFVELLEEGKLGRPDEVVSLNLIIRADVRGTIEAILKELEKLEHPEIEVKVLLAGVGGVTVGDVTLADASQAVIIAFNVIPEENARQLADERQVEIRRYDIIYKVTDDIRATLEGKLKPEERVVELGRALVKQVFPISRVGSVAGCYAISGNIERGCRLRVFRDNRLIGEYDMASLRREKDDVKTVQRGMECGIRLQGFDDVKKDDVLEAYKIEEVARTL